MPLQVPFDEETLREVLIGNKGPEVLLQTVMNEILRSELTEHLGAEPGEQTDNRRGYRNGSYQRKLTTRVGTIELEVPRDRDGTFQTELFERYQRSEKALVTTLVQMVVQGVSTRRVKKITTELCGREFSRQTVSNLTERLDEQVKSWSERSLGGVSLSAFGRDAAKGPAPGSGPLNDGNGRGWHQRGGLSRDSRFQDRSA